MRAEARGTDRPEACLGQRGSGLCRNRKSAAGVGAALGVRGRGQRPDASWGRVLSGRSPAPAHRAQTFPGLAGKPGAVTWGGAGRGRTALTPPLRPSPASSAGARGVAGVPGEPCPPTSPWCLWRRGRTAARMRVPSRPRRRAPPRAVSPTARARVSAAAPARGTKAEAGLRGAGGRWEGEGREEGAAREGGGGVGGGGGGGEGGRGGGGGMGGREGRATWARDVARGRGVGLLSAPPPPDSQPAPSSHSSLVSTALPASVVPVSPPPTPPACRAPSPGLVVEALAEGFRGGGPSSAAPPWPPPGPRKHLSPTRGGPLGRCETPWVAMETEEGLFLREFPGPVTRWGPHPW